ncbi:MAG: DUF2202 domain-containing protein [Lewinellaceae bacterium]|nr:DUF2202 domain-containing protein [Phaeodactylibacter sp.]MCB9041896.1 DUF2202 domain-containing protein [Lewinellaceae bacterium]
MKKLLFLLLALSWPALQALQAQTSLSKADQKTLIYLAEEEKVVRDFYQAMEAKWEATVFSHIAGAEQRHFNRAVDAAASLGIELPGSLAADKPGEFQNKELQQFYDELMASGSQSLEAALRAGARAEETDIRDLKQALETTQNETIRTTYQYLLEASGNHLRAFHKNLAAQGVTYRPVVLAQADFDAIIAVGEKGQGCQGQKGQQGEACCQKKGGQKGQCCQGAQKGNCQGKGKGKQSLN